LGTPYLALAPRGTADAFATVVSVQLALVALLAVGGAALPRCRASPLPRFTAAAADGPVVDA